MAKWWMGVALAAVMAGQQSAALAQNPATGGGPPAEPAPCAPSMLGQNVIPGPLPANALPPGPGGDLSLPGNHDSAFACEQVATHPECYFSIGSLAYQRQRLGHGLVAFQDPGGGLDTGTVPIANRDLFNTSLDYNALVPTVAWGVSATLGYAVDDWAFEATGFYIPQQSKGKTVTNPGLLNLNFINPPLGFEGDNGLWLQADRVTVTSTTALASGELSIRYASRAVAGIEPLLGVRYLDVRDKVSIFTDDDGISFPDINGAGDPLRMATYSVSAHSHIIAPQLGLELEVPICHHVAFNACAKGAWGANFYTQNIQLVRGDGFSAINTHNSHTQFSHLYDLGFHFDVYLLERMRLRAGYNLLWVLNIPEAVDQVDYDLMNRNGSRHDNGSIFYYGPMVQLDLLF